MLGAVTVSGNEPEVGNEKNLPSCTLLAVFQPSFHFVQETHRQRQNKQTETERERNRQKEKEHEMSKIL